MSENNGLQKKCLICGGKAKWGLCVPEPCRFHIVFHVSCRTCGEYTFTGQQFCPALVEGIKSLISGVFKEEQRHVLSAATRHSWECERKAFCLADETMKKAKEEFGHLTMEKKAELLLRRLVRNSAKLGDPVLICHERDYPLGVCHDGEELHSLLGYLHQKGFLDRPCAAVNNLWPYVVSGPGWNKIESQEPRLGFHRNNS